MARSPAHYRAAVEEPDGWTTPARLFGTLVHAIVLGADFVVFPGKARRGKEWTAFAAANEGRPIVTTPEYDRAMACAESVLRHPVAAPLLRGRREVDLEWSVLGRACAGRLDVIGSGFITDVKTTTCASPGWFRYQAMKLGYHAQLSWYREGALQNGHRVDYTYITAIETRPPFPVTVMQPTPRALEEGEKLTRTWMERLLACEAANEYPEYAQTIVELDVPDDVELLFEEDG
jgi:hypothetical protein